MRTLTQHECLSKVPKQENQVSFRQVGGNRLRHNHPQKILRTAFVPLSDDFEVLDAVAAKRYEGLIPSAHFRVAFTQEQRHAEPLVTLFVGDVFQHFTPRILSETSTVFTKKKKKKQMVDSPSGVSEML